VTWVFVGLGGAAGSILRYLTDRRVQRWHDSVFPWGTLTVNVVGSLLLGFLSGWALRDGLHALLAVGFCGGLTTFSTFGYETVRLFLEKTRLYAVLNVVVTTLAGLASGALGLILAARLWS